MSLDGGQYGAAVRRLSTMKGSIMGRTGNLNCRDLVGEGGSWFRMVLSLSSPNDEKKKPCSF